MDTLLITQDVGAAGVWAPSGLSRNARALVLTDGFYESTYSEGLLVLGETIARTQQRYADQGEDKYLLDINNLLGDPATIMK